MTHDIGQNGLFEALDALLERERNALIDGDLAAISELIEEKEGLLDQIAALDGAGKRGLEDLQGKAIRNQALLDSALRGIRNVASRFAALRKVRKSLETYDEKGRKTSLAALPENKVEKRA